MNDITVLNSTTGHRIFVGEGVANQPDKEKSEKIGLRYRAKRVGRTTLKGLGIATAVGLPVAAAYNITGASPGASVFNGAIAGLSVVSFAPFINNISSAAREMTYDRLVERSLRKAATVPGNKQSAAEGFNNKLSNAREKLQATRESAIKKLRNVRNRAHNKGQSTVGWIENISKSAAEGFNNKLSNAKQEGPSFEKQAEIFANEGEPGLVKYLREYYDGKKQEGPSFEKQAEIFANEGEPGLVKYLREYCDGKKQSGLK